MKINREELLKQLESVLPGLSTKEIIEQSSCFIFKKETVHTFNDEIACSQKTLLKIEGAVQAMPLISILRKLKGEEIDIETNEENTQLLIRNKKTRERIGIHMESDITLPVDAVEEPKKWKTLSSNFADAVAIVQPCAGSNEAEFMMTCIHIAPEWIEACDNHQVSRYKIKTDIVKSTLVRKESLKHIISLDMTKFSETKNWIHFKNSTGLILSCRHFVAGGEEEGYPSNDITKILKVKGVSFVLPKGLKETVEKAEIFSSENVESNDIIVNLKAGKFKITGRGASGWYVKPKKTKYDGKPLQFTIPPKLLLELVQQHNECIISAEHLKVTGSHFEYVTALGMVEEKE